ncbi:MAG TPA: phenylalanine--tRNA ligase subunit alpha [Chloroflexi bacterium]|nr:phenylalanine--tRNA ligase subunit alpha [Chloroflexota bacterium]HHW85415.1 phenylalanine--tRNA ligase subunit alpha [Chloroflexota bacterium]
MSDLIAQLEQLQVEAQAALTAAQSTSETEAWYADFLGRKGRLTAMLRGLGQLSKEERPLVGKRANEIKEALEAALAARQEAIAAEEMQRTLAAEGIDVTLPGRRPQVGKLHPTNQAMREMVEILKQMGFQVFDSPEVETDAYNFELLNFPPDHPAREMQDTFFTTTPDVILRTHTSPGQLHAMRQYAPEPIRVILPGKCYRNEDVTARSEMMFYQIEGLAIGRNITFSDLKGTLLNFANQMYGEGRKIRFRKSYFPFTEPSVEFDVDCILCGGVGCRICKYTGWLEILGAGMVHPIVLKNGGYDPALFSGFAFGMGIERQAMLKRGVDDIRLFYSNDVRFLERV